MTQTLNSQATQIAEAIAYNQICILDFCETHSPQLILAVILELNQDKFDYDYVWEVQSKIDLLSQTFKNY